MNAEHSLDSLSPSDFPNRSEDDVEAADTVSIPRQVDDGGNMNIDDITDKVVNAAIRLLPRELEVSTPNVQRGSGHRDEVHCDRQNTTFSTQHPLPDTMGSCTAVNEKKKYDSQPRNVDVAPTPPKQIQLQRRQHRVESGNFNPFAPFQCTYPSVYPPV